ncbi:MAG: holo-ACP synthase [Acidimicrobiales bacterium]|nr:holo-ACP synthase [Acidimicrobiales bacterium]
MTAPPLLRVGTDIVDVDRMRTALNRTPRLRERLFRPDEREYAERVADPAKRYAARFAAKEATLKALGRGLGEVPLFDIEVVRSESGAPAIVLHDAAVGAASSAGVHQLELSLTHTDLVAHAIVVAVYSALGAADYGTA